MLSKQLIRYASAAVSAAVAIVLVIGKIAQAALFLALGYLAFSPDEAAAGRRQAT